jgi:hypothetical protein
MEEEKTETKKINEKKTYTEWLKKEYGDIIDTLELSDIQKLFLRSRWLDQVLWMEGRANAAQWYYYRLRLATIIGGILIPALVSLDLSGITGSIFRYLSIIIGLIVAISAASEQFFNYGERWRHYRHTVETLKMEGWKFFQLSDNYQNYKKHSDAYPAFAKLVENVIQRDVDVFITEIVKEKKEQEEQPGANQ